MQLLLRWLNELVSIESISLEKLIDKLTVSGFEVEEIKKVKIKNKTQFILDISATANRSDSLSIQGLSAEIVTLFNKSNKISEYSLKLTDWKKNINKASTIISNKFNCSAFIAITIENLNTIQVPKWIKQKLSGSGITPTNSLLDFENYILLETGYTFAMYDFHKICSKLNSADFKLILSNRNENEAFIGSNNNIYQLNSKALIVKANYLPISIAGVIESKNYSYSLDTTSLLIEASIFDAYTIRQQSRSFGIRTQRSARYEKSLKKKYLIEALYRLISLLKISNPNIICKLHTIAQIPNKDLTLIKLKYSTINAILGPIIQKNKEETVSYIKPEIITNYLASLNFKFSYDEGKLTWKVKIPELRSDDITREIDLIEEIGRLYGFNRFVATLPKINNIGNEDISYKVRKKITSCLINLGFNELIHYSLVSENKFLNNKVKIINPLLNDFSNLRLSLLPSLLQTVQDNLKQKNMFIEGFEYGHVFSSQKSKTFQEKEFLAGIFGGVHKKLKWSDAEHILTWFEAKGKIEQLLKQLNITSSWTTINCNNNKLLHPYRSAKIYLKNELELGIFGQINPILANKLGIPSDVYLFEFDVKVIQGQLQTNKLALYKKYSFYPKVIKDLSFVVKNEISFQEIKNFLTINGTKFLSEVNLLDEYIGESIPKKHKSICLQLVFQSKDMTLENKKIENIVNNLQLVLIDEFHVVIRN